MNEQWWLAACQPVDHVARQKAGQRQARLTKPSGSLGRLESLAVELAGLQGRECPHLEQPWIAVFAGDHGVVAEGVSAYPQAVTRQMLHNFVAGGAAISVLAHQLQARLEVIDLGTVGGEPLGGVHSYALGPGTANFTQGPAMSVAQCVAALDAGRASVERARQVCAGLYIGGEMGIGNTTAAAALGCALLDLPALALTGPGTGLDAAGLSHKQRVIDSALLLHQHAGSEPFEVLRRLGGFEIAALAGAFVACAQHGLPVLVDGFITTVAALCAVRLNPACRPWLLFGHRSAEPGHALVLQALKAEPLLDLGLRLGEGSGAALAVPLLRLACSLHGGMATFEEAQVSDRPA
ncbi:nicotinate-nucleotide--dimethylbenzimidazole phosphoribosyltransferase [Geopseudomonas guangdongensis]|uniref:Nicotinate-nucleotide--dimethylbenzimidazole phosphoribosyltransferase n=1 Tax=Geopseudomonas guangdongensis TaxID=1245526 RepID=A0A1H2HEQ7_9GAMM|nr:nicotinate-nucleotide--dimethylbenzimidazole phosphoribosyltransferase [Pseudomonas guangdongensis]SDU30305.1 nicotinate-nucleotide-dimethylbenzimidazole phosphoribosyltransferase [Pseudomonas guangdongensis]